MRPLTFFMTTSFLALTTDCATSFLPVGISIGTSPSASCSRKPSSFTLAGRGSNVATLDYGYEVAGFPYFVVASLNKPVQIELKFSEQFDGLNHVLGDGPLDFAVGLSSSYRVETFNVTKPGRYESFFIQGGQRWELLTLLTNGHLTFSDVGFRPSINKVDMTDIPSQFNCSNDLYNSIWKLGARAVTAACVDAGTQLATWQITDEGAYVPGQKAGSSVFGVNFQNYKLVFETKIDRAGTGWSFLTSPEGTGYSLLLISNLPEANTFINTNTSLTPRNTVVLSWGWGAVNQSTLESYHLNDFSVPFEVYEDVWYTVQTSLSSNGYLSVSVGSHQIFNVSIETYNWVPNLVTGSYFGSADSGSFGFGPWQDHAAYFRNVTVYAENGTQLYHNNLDTVTTLSEYGVETNTASVCLDGAKRDRLVWLGDFFHTSRIIPASTGRNDLTSGTLAYLVSWQNPLGLLSIAPPMGYPSTYKNVDGAFDGTYFILQDYQILGLVAYYNYYWTTGDISFTQSQWPAFQSQVAFLLSTIDPITGLCSISGFLGPSYGSAISSLLVQGLNGAAIIATALGDTASAATYSASANKVALGINTYLWNAKLKIYALSNASMSDTSVSGLSFAITSGVANATRASAALAALSSLKLAPGYKDSTLVSNSDATANISPNTNGFLLSAAMIANDTAPVKYMLDNLWAAMVTNNLYRSGASWEYVGQDLRPGLALFTSLSHPWGGAPTYVLPEYVAGIRPASAGYKTWLIIPAYAGFSLDYASASITTTYGVLTVRWTLAKGCLTVIVNAPTGTQGTLQLPGGKKLGMVTINGKAKKGGTELALGSGMSTVVLEI